MIIRILGFLLAYLTCLSVAAQHTEKQYSEVDMGYNLMRALSTDPRGLIRQRTVGKTDFDGQFITYENLNEYNRHTSKIFDNKPYVDFDTLLIIGQKEELIRKIENLTAVNLDAERLIPTVLSDEEIEKRLKNKKMGESFGYGIVSFPIIQEGKTGEIYAIIYKTSAIYPAGDPGGNIYVYIKGNDQWELFCVANVFV
ncbi:hypothetical protein [Anditalea andensis]|uniref:Uncharacterized protein n=1 Tax=Anditalea andensis TaxID=1048983 RepID=A0A074L5X4_9BACT|nr:hypothetical protein [Anditalea andensis]KEO75228.1 hypothetical protein EL17_06085 [Anditalea andensis]